MASSHKKEPPRSLGSAAVSACGAALAYFAFASRDFCRAAAFMWMSPLRAARSSSCTAFALSAGDEASTFAVFIAVRSVARWERLRAVAVRVLRMFFFADAILGTS